MSSYGSFTPPTSSSSHSINVQPTWQQPINTALLQQHQLNNQSLLSYIRRNRLILRLGLWLGSSTTIWRINALIYLTALITSIVLLSVGWHNQQIMQSKQQHGASDVDDINQLCSPNLHFFFAVIFTRSFFGLRIAYWQTHIDFTDVISVDAYFKASWDLVAVLTALVLLTSIHTDTTEQCKEVQPMLYMAAYVFSIILCTGYCARTLLWLMTKLTQKYVPDIVHIYLRSIYNIVICGSPFQTRFDSSTGMTQLELESIPVILYDRQLFNNPEDTMCVICLVSYQLGDEMRVLNCGHVYHRHCIDRWLARKPACAICIRQVQVSNPAAVDETTALQAAPPPQPQASLRAGTTNPLFHDTYQQRAAAYNI